MGRKTWTKEDINFLTENYLDLSKEELIKKFGKTWKAISNKALALGLKKCNFRKLWTESELNFLKKQYEHNTQNYIMNNLKNRTWKAIREKAISLG